MPMQQWLPANPRDDVQSHLRDGYPAPDVPRLRLLRHQIPLEAGERHPRVHRNRAAVSGHLPGRQQGGIGRIRERLSGTRIHPG